MECRMPWLSMKYHILKIPKEHGISCMGDAHRASCSRRESKCFRGTRKHSNICLIHRISHDGYTKLFPWYSVMLCFTALVLADYQVHWCQFIINYPLTCIALRIQVVSPKELRGGESWIPWIPQLCDHMVKKSVRKFCIWEDPSPVVLRENTVSISAALPACLLPIFGSGWAWVILDQCS